MRTYTRVKKNDVIYSEQYFTTCNPWADPEVGTGGPDPPPWNFGKNVLIGFVKWYWFDIAQHLCKIQS